MFSSGLLEFSLSHSTDSIEDFVDCKLFMRVRFAGRKRDRFRLVFATCTVLTGLSASNTSKAQCNMLLMGGNRRAAVLYSRRVRLP